MATKKTETDTEFVIDEVRMLKRLETIDRELKALGEERKAAMDEFKETKDALEGQRDAVLVELDEHRLGVRKLLPEVS
jgi:hypothetical protein